MRSDCHSGICFYLSPCFFTHFRDFCGRTESKGADFPGVIPLRCHCFSAHSIREMLPPEFRLTTQPYSKDFPNYCGPAALVVKHYAEAATPIDADGPIPKVFPTQHFQRNESFHENTTTKNNGGGIP